MTKKEQHTSKVKQKVVKNTAHDNKSDSRKAGEFGVFSSPVRTEIAVREAVKNKILLRLWGVI